MLTRGHRHGCNTFDDNSRRAVCFVRATYSTIKSDNDFYSVPLGDVRPVFAKGIRRRGIRRISIYT